MDHPALTESTYYILLSLYHPQHGYGIMQETQQLSGGRVRLAAGTLYGALNALCEKGWISPLPMESGSRKKESGCRCCPAGCRRTARPRCWRKQPAEAQR